MICVIMILPLGIVYLITEVQNYYSDNINTRFAP